MARNGLQPTFPPTVSIYGTNFLHVLWSYIATSLVHLLGPLSFFYPQPRTPWAVVGASNEHSTTLSLPLVGTTTIVTGANAGLGFELAKAHFARGSHVCMGCRDATRANAARRAILKQTRAPGVDEEQDERERGARLRVITLDTSSNASVRTFADEWRKAYTNGTTAAKLDYLFLNAGIVSPPRNSGNNNLTKDGFPLVYATNVLGHFLLTALLSADLAEDVRIVVTSSAASVLGSFDPRAIVSRNFDGPQRGFHFPSYDGRWSGPMPEYGQSKAMQVAFTNSLQLRFDKSSRTREAARRRRFAGAYHPGFVATSIFSAAWNAKDVMNMVGNMVMRAIALSPEQGAKAGLWLAHTYDAQPGGLYERTTLRSSAWYRSWNASKAEQLWQRLNADAGLKDADWRL